MYICEYMNVTITHFCFNIMCIQEGISPLFVAVEANEYGTASKLIQKGASVNLVKVSNKIIIICD